MSKKEKIKSLKKEVKQLKAQVKKLKLASAERKKAKLNKSLGAHAKTPMPPAPAIAKLEKADAPRDPKAVASRIAG
jgi:hypothetical protein